MDYSDYYCPFCGEVFEEESDVVVCPDCGTPHHRACWKEIGKCFNSDKHGTDENLRENCRLKYQSDSVDLDALDEQKQQTQAEANPSSSSDPITDSKPAQPQLINGKPAVLYEIALKKNQEYYMPRFIGMGYLKMKVKTPNFWACLVPLAWSVYRKMYKVAAAMLALYVLIFAVSGYFLYSNEAFIQASNECAQEDPFYYENILLYDSGQDVTLTAKQQNLIEAMNNIEIPPVVGVTASVILIATRILLGMKADELYMKEIGKTISKGEALGYTGDKLKMFVFRKKGTVPIAISVLIGIFELFTFYF